MDSARKPTPVGPLPSWEWEHIEAGTDLSSSDTVVAWTDGDWHPAQVGRRNVRTVDVTVYDWNRTPHGAPVHRDDLPAHRREKRARDGGRFPVERIARRRRERDGEQ
jgi:hypothetical protein